MSYSCERLFLTVIDGEHCLPLGLESPRDTGRPWPFSRVSFATRNIMNDFQTLLTLPTRDTQTSGCLIQLFQSGPAPFDISTNFRRRTNYLLSSFFIVENKYILQFRIVPELTGHSSDSRGQSNYFPIAAERREETSFQLAT